MSKLIKLTPEVIEECKREFAEAINLVKCSDGKVTYTKTLGTLDAKATVHYTTEAWEKQNLLIREFDKEVAWHGVAVRDEEDRFLYHITDILVYPQEVTGATVTTDQEKYQDWLYAHEDDVFNNIRMQGHSHVNMGVTPSGVDTTLYDKLLEQLDDTMFYIFMIWNKRGEKTVKIYDLRENVFFDTTDVTVKVGNGAGLDEFLANAKELVQTRVYNPPANPTNYGYGNQYGRNYTGNYGGYGGYGGYYGNKGAAAITQEKTTTSEKTALQTGGGVSRQDGKNETMHYRGNGNYSYGYGGDYDDWD